MNTSEITIKVGLVDDHNLVRLGLANMINGFGDFRVVLQASSGEDLIKQIQGGSRPDIVLLDLNMPVMDGVDTAVWMRENHPAVKILMLTMYDSELALIRLLKVGVRGFLKKDSHPSELKFAIQSVLETGYYYSHQATGKLMNLFRNKEENALTLENAMLTDIEVRFLKLVCSDLTYKEMAGILHTTPRGVDTIRDQLFTKLDVKSRVGLALAAIKHGIVQL